MSRRSSGAATAGTLCVVLGTAGVTAAPGAGATGAGPGVGANRADTVRSQAAVPVASVGQDARVLDLQAPRAQARQPLLRRGDRGPQVAAVQQRLSDLRYWLGVDPVDGIFGPLTEQAVYAVQKAAGIARDGIVGPNTRAALARATKPQPRSTSGHVIEVDLDRQLLVLADNGRVTHTFNTSAGTFEYYYSGGRRYLADTPHGQWRVYRQVDGWRVSHLGRLYRPKYFHRDGIAVHGYTHVPPYAASHGCVRLTIPAINWFWEYGQIPIGTLVWVY